MCEFRFHDNPAGKFARVISQGDYGVNLKIHSHRQTCRPNSIALIGRSPWQCHSPRFSLVRGLGEHSGPWCRPAHKPHIEGETIKIYYRFHPLAGKRAVKLGHRSHRGEPVLMVGCTDGRRYIIPRWITDPEAAEWNLRDVPRLSPAALSELHGLVATILRKPVSPETGGRNETSKTKDTAEEAAAHPAATGQPAEGDGKSGRLGVCGADCGGDATAGIARQSG